MSEWREVTLGEAIDVLHGYAFKGEYFCEEGELIVLTPGNFCDDGGFKPKSGKEKYYDGPFPPRFLLDEGDVVVAMTEQVQGLLGSSATIPESGVYLHNQRIGLVRINDPDLLNVRFVYHLMNTPLVRSQIQATATGSKVRPTAPERIKAVRAAVPDMSDQRRIAAILDSIDDLIENNGRRVDVLEEMARATYRDWFVHFRFPGHEDAPFVDSPLGPIPDGWVVRPFSEIASLAYFTWRLASGTVELVGVGTRQAEQTERAAMAAEASALAAVQAAPETARARLDARAPRVVAFCDPPLWPPLIDKNRSAMP